MENNFLKTLALEYLKSKYDIKNLTIAEYFEHYSDIYSELSDLNDSAVSKTVNENAKKWLDS